MMRVARSIPLYVGLLQLAVRESVKSGSSICLVVAEQTAVVCFASCPGR